MGLRLKLIFKSCGTYLLSFILCFSIFFTFKKTSLIWLVFKILLIVILYVLLYPSFNLIHQRLVQSVSGPFFHEIAWCCGDPSNMVFLISFDKINPLKNICNIVNSPFLDVKLDHSFIEIQAFVLGFHKKEDEFLGKLNKPVFFPSLLTRVHIMQGHIFHFQRLSSVFVC